MSNLPYIEYSVTSEPWDPDELGNHRAIIDVSKRDGIVGVRIPWRRRDRDPEKKGMLLYSEAGNAVDFFSAHVGGSHGDILFEPSDGPGRYYLYFMPYQGEVKVPYPKAEYLKPDTSETELRKTYGTLDWEDVPKADVPALECVDEFNMFTDMELTATEDEFAALYKVHRDDPFLLFPEYRENPIRMFNALPYRWVAKGPAVSLDQRVRRGEMYIYQLGLHAHHESLSDVNVSFEDLTSEDGYTAANVDKMRCFNTGGRGWDGSQLSFTIDVSKGRTQPLWCGIEVDENAVPGNYSTRVTVAANGHTQSVTLNLTVLDEVIRHHGDDDASLLSRLRWLDSDIGTEDDTIPPYIPVSLETDGRDTVKILGRDVTIAPSGLPEQIVSYFSDDLNTADADPFPLLHGPMEFDITEKGGSNLSFEYGTVEIGRRGASFIQWQVDAQSSSMHMNLAATMEFDGTVEYEIRLHILEDITLEDIQFTAPFNLGAARYMTGLGRTGGAVPDDFSWKWDPEFNQDAVWIGAVNGGIQFTFKDKSYSRPLNTNFYHLKPLIMPESWANENNGTITLKTAGDCYTLTCSGGPRELKSGDTLDFDMRLLISPFKPIDTRAHFSTRYYHQYLPIDEILEAGGNTVNIHHCTDINPYINYPFLTPDEMADYISEAHAKQCRVKLYYTVRELTTRTPEIFALKSLGNEIFVDGEGGGHAWLQEHLDDGYIAAWYAMGKRDTSAINGILSRWHNFYVEGMNWLAENLEIDGVYIDDLGFGREIMKRVKRILHRHRDQPLIDLHSANQYNERDGYASSTNLYMEHFPYLERLWFGEYFDYNEDPDYWLVEVSGLPFGLMGEMLQDGGNPWRGMVFGMTGRMPRVKLNQQLWKMWDRYDLPNATMKGFWSSSCPASLSNEQLRATAFIADKHTIIAVASWAEGSVDVAIDVDWKQIGLDPSNATVDIPNIPGFQDERLEVDLGCVTVEPGKGALIVIAT